MSATIINYPLQQPLLPLQHATRQQVFDTLFAYLKNCPSPAGVPWKTFSQALAQWDNVPAADQPAMFLRRGAQIAEQKHAFGVTKWVFKANVWVYFRTENWSTQYRYPDQLTDQFLDGFEQLFQIQTQPAPFTLSNNNLLGIVKNVWIDGMLFSDPGLVDNQAVIVIPLSIEL
jgi:hypothetical protein